MARILIIDSDAGMREAASEMLLNHHHEAVLCPSVAFAIERLHEFAPDVITTNLRVPNGGNCFDILRICRELSTPPPVIVISGCDSVETITEVMKRGAFEYLVKPVKLHNLQRTIQRALDCRHMGLESGCHSDSLRKVGGTFAIGSNEIRHSYGRNFSTSNGVLKNRKRAVLAAVVLLLAAWLYPPWFHYKRSENTPGMVKHPQGYFFLFDTRQDETPEILQTVIVRLDFGRLAVESFVVTAMALGFATVPKR